MIYDILEHNGVTYEVHRERMKKLHAMDIVERHQGHTFRLHPGCTGSTKELVEIMLDLNGDQL